MARTKSKTHAQLARDLRGFLGAACAGMEVEVGLSKRWKRTCLTFRWAGFADLLPEERFRSVARLIPPDYFENELRGAVWLELAPGETIEDYLSQPRSEDIDEKLPAVWKMLRKAGFFEALEDELARVSPAQRADDLSLSKRVLGARRLSHAQIRDACLAFIRQQAYTDEEVLRQVRPIAEA